LWSVKLTQVARRQLKRLDEDIRKDAVSILLDLEAGEFPSDVIRLRNHEQYERVRFAGGPIPNDLSDR